MTWQQLHNPLQWTEPPLADRLAGERQRRGRPGGPLWIRRYTPLRESDALIRTLTGHTDGVWGCAVSPDGSFIVSATGDQTVKVWDVASGTERATLVLPGSATAVATHPSTPMVACGDVGGGVHLTRLIGLPFGPLVVTATDRGHRLTVRCPACREAFPVDRGGLGADIDCPRAACRAGLRLNPFVLCTPRLQSSDPRRLN